MPFDRPTTIELIQSTQEYLQDCIHVTDSEKANGAATLNMRIASNILKIVERELTLGNALNQQENLRLQHLLDRQGTLAELNQWLTLAIRENRIAYDDPDLQRHLQQTTLGKLSVDNPKYSTYKQLYNAQEDATKI
ncbi:hypothetical protein A9Q99_10755 [Gammaproteobacteria bacterium 45_16_T64]|nr:hypothetical protein A9Q99_10755 [Gammaproteobacteria bacterium 45_16_T64]